MNWFGQIQKWLLSYALLGSTLVFARDAKINFTMQNLEPGQTDSTVTFSPNGGRYTGTCSGGVDETWSGITYYTPTSCSGTYQTYSSRVGARPGLRFDSFFVLRSIISNRQLSVMRSAGNCPNTSTQYNYILIRGRNPNDFVGPMDFSLSSTWAGGTFTYSNSALTGVSRFSLANLSAVSQSTNAFSYQSLNGNCASGEWFSETTDFSDAPLSNYANWLFGENLAVSMGEGGNPIVTVAVPATSLSAQASFWQNKNKNVYSSLMTTFDGKGTQVQKVVYLISDGTGRSFSVSEANSLSDTSQRASLGTLNCSTLNSPSNGFCSGTLSLGGQPSVSGNAVCLFSFETQGKDLIFCAAQKPSDSTRLITLMGATSSRSVVQVAAASPLHLNQNQTSGTLAITVTNLTARPVLSLNPDALSAPNRLSTPFVSISNTGSLTGNLGDGGFISGSTCGAVLPAYSSCTIQVTYSPSTLRMDKQTFRLPYEKISGVYENATVPLMASRGLTALSVTAPHFTTGSSSQAVVTASYADGSDQDVTALVDLTSSNSGQMPITSGGAITSPAAATTNITATFGNISGSATVTAYSAAPNPTQLTATPVSGTQINLSWTSGGAGTTGYQIVRKAGASAPTDCWDGTVRLPNVQGTATTASFTGLAVGSQHSFRVCAVNGANTLTSGITATATTFSLPGAPTAVAGTGGDNQIVLTWSAPANNGGGAITDYVIQYSSNSGSSWATFSDGTSASTGAIVTGLLLGSYYIFRVATVNGAGTGPYSGNSDTIRFLPAACAGDCYLEGTAPNYAQGLALGTERQGPGSAIIELVSASGSFKVWKEVGGSGRILNASGYTDRGWQKKLIRAGTAFDINLTDTTVIAGRACPTHVFIDSDEMTATNRCLYYDGGSPVQTLSRDLGSEGEDWLKEWDRTLTARGTGSSFFEGNIKTCADKGMRLPVIYETAATSLASGLGGGSISSSTSMPGGDGIAPAWAGANGVPSVSPDYMWTASAFIPQSSSKILYWSWSGSVATYDQYAGQYSNSAVRCVLPNGLSTPMAPIGITGSIGNNGSIALSWTAPSENGGSAITDYRIQYSQDAGATWSTYTDAVSTNTTATLTGLTQGTAHLFRVAALNVNGAGPYSGKSSALTPNILCGAAGNSCYDNNNAKTFGVASLQDGNQNSETPTVIEFVIASGSFKIWREQTVAAGQSVKRVLHASGLWSNGWQYKLNPSGKGFSGTLLDGTTEISQLAGKACPSNGTLPSVFINDDSVSNKFAIGYCLYYDSGTPAQQTLSVAAGTLGSDYLGTWNDASSGRGSEEAWYEGNIQVCKAKGMRLPTAFETRMSEPTSNLPIVDGDPASASSPKPVFAGSTDGVPNSTGYTWTATANPSSVNSYRTWSGTTAGQRDYNLTNYVRCVLP